MQLSKILSALALLGAAIPSTYALSIKDDTVKLGVAIRLQTRATLADATGQNGEEYRVQGGEASAKNDPIDLSIRRARLYLKIGYGDNWKGELAFNADQIDNGTTGTPPAATAAGSGTNRALQARYAWMQRTWKMEGDMSHSVAFGLMKPYNAPSDGAMSSSRTLFPTENFAASIGSVREIGIEYMFKHPMFVVAVDLFNNESDKNFANAASADEAEGFYYGARAEFSFSPEWFIAKRAESFLGKEGKGLNVGISYAANTDEVNAADTQTFTSFGVDVMLWFNNISAYLEFRNGTDETEPFAGGSSEVKEQAIVAQVGYAFPMESGSVIEPALRFQKIDEDTDDDNEASEFGNGELGGSGTQIDIGVNYYLDGHDNKFQAAVQLWSAEEGDADATIIYVQHQLNF